MALKLVLRSAIVDKSSPTLHAKLSILMDKTSERLITTPEEVVMKLAQMETVVLSPDPQIPPGT